MPITHHGAMFSYYSAKSRAYLSYKRIPFEERYDGTALQGRIAEVTHKNMIPVVELDDGEILQDTTVIIDTFEARYPQRPVMPEDPLLLLLGRIVEFVIDEFWIGTAMNTRWNDPVSNKFAARDFGNLFGPSLGLQGDAALHVGTRIAERMQAYLPGLGIADEAGQAAVSQYFREASQALDAAVDYQQFLFGPRPSLIDFCAYTGYFAHQYRDAGTAQQFLKTTTPNLCYYLDNLTVAHTLPDSGELALHEATVDYLAVLAPPGGRYAQALEALAATRLADAEAGGLVDGLLGEAVIDLNGHDYHRHGSMFSAWKTQRVRDAYAAMSEDTRATAAPVLKRIGWWELLQHAPGYRLARQDYQTVLETNDV